MSETLRYLKQVIVIRKDLSMPRGKLAAMAAHASITFLLKKLRIHPLPPEDGSGKSYGSCYLTNDEAQWLTELDPGPFCRAVMFLEELNQLSMAKIVCEANSEAELRAIEQKAREAGLTVFGVTDSGHSHNKMGDYAAIAIGPHWPEQLAPVTGELKVYR